MVKQRLQMMNSQYRGVWECARHVYRAEGLRAFYRSYATQVAMNVPFQVRDVCCCSSDEAAATDLNSQCYCRVTFDQLCAIEIAILMSESWSNLHAL